MAKRRSDAPAAEASAATVGYEAQLWQMADAPPGSLDAADHEHIVLGLSSLKYNSDAFEEQHARLVADRKLGADPEDPDEYRALSNFWVPPAARWQHLKAQARQPTIGQHIEDAMAGIECDNPALEGVLANDYARLTLDKTRIGQEFVRAHAQGNGTGGKATADISIYGQESNCTTWRAAKASLAIRGVAGRIAHGDTFHNDCFPDPKVDYTLANSPFNDSDSGCHEHWKHASVRMGTNCRQARHCVGYAG